MKSFAFALTLLVVLAWFSQRNAGGDDPWTRRVVNPDAAFSSAESQLLLEDSAVVVSEHFIIHNTPSALRNATTPSIVFYNQAWVVAHFLVTYTDGPSQKNWTWETSDVTIYHKRQVDIPANATNLRVVGKYSKLYEWVTLFDVALDAPPEPPDNCFMMQGTLFKMKWNKNCLITENDKEKYDTEAEVFSGEGKELDQPQLRTRAFTQTQS